jgi:hypothetical protein
VRKGHSGPGWEKVPPRPRKRRDGPLFESKRKGGEMDSELFEIAKNEAVKCIHENLLEVLSSYSLTLEEDKIYTVKDEAGNVLLEGVNHGDLYRWTKAYCKEQASRNYLSLVRGEE